MYWWYQRWKDCPPVTDFRRQNSHVFVQCLVLLRLCTDFLYFLLHLTKTEGEIIMYNHFNPAKSKTCRVNKDFCTELFHHWSDFTIMTESNVVHTFRWGILNFSMCLLKKRKTKHWRGSKKLHVNAAFTRWLRPRLRLQPRRSPPTWGAAGDVLGCNTCTSQSSRFRPDQASLCCTDTQVSGEEVDLDRTCLIPVVECTRYVHPRTSDILQLRTKM